MWLYVDYLKGKNKRVFIKSLLAPAQAATPFEIFFKKNKLSICGAP